jgi:hypothetical protein
MKYIQQTQSKTRESILKLLSSDEIASLSRAETAQRLGDGDEYLDLEHIERGVRRAGRMVTPMGRVLPRKSVHESTWLKIVEQLSALRRATLN